MSSSRNRGFQQCLQCTEYPKNNYLCILFESATTQNMSDGRKAGNSVHQNLLGLKGWSTTSANCGTDLKTTDHQRTRICRLRWEWTAFFSKIKLIYYYCILYRISHTTRTRWTQWKWNRSHGKYSILVNRRGRIFNRLNSWIWENK